MFFEKILVPEKRIYHRIFFIVITIITIFLSIGLFNIETDTDITVLLPVNEETVYEREKINRLGKEFSSNQLLFIGVKNDPFSKDNIKILWELCNEIEKLEVVKSTFNPFNATYFKKVGRIFSIKRMKMDKYPKTEKDREKFIQSISSNRYLVGSIISYDKKTAGIVVRTNYDAMMGEEIEKKNIFMKFAEFAFDKKFGPKQIDRSYFCGKIEEVIAKYNPPFEIFYAGVPVYEAKSKEYMQRDIFILIIPAFILMTFILFMNFRTVRGTILPILSILLSMIWTMGILGWLRVKLDIVGILIPPIIMTVGSSYTLHYLNSYYINVPFYDNSRELVLYSTKSIFPTISLASMTTVVGFASFLTAKIMPVKKFGIFIIISIIFTLFFTFFLLSKILTIFNLPKLHKMENVRKDLFAKILSICRKIVIPLRFIWVGIYIMSIILFCLFISKLKIETNAINFFKGNDIVKRSLTFLQYNFHGTNHYNITIRSRNHERDFFRTKKGMLAAQKIQDYFNEQIVIDGHEMIGWMLSPVTMLQDLNQTLNGELRVPEDESVIKKFFTFLKLSKDDGIKSIINDDFSAITFQIRPHTDNAKVSHLMSEQELAKLSQLLSTDLKKIADDDGTITVEVWGEILLLSKISKYLSKDQINSLLITGILVFLITLLIFRSPYFAFFSLIPLSFGVIMNFTIMSIFQIPLDAATVMIAALSIGIGIDDSIHFILHYKKTLKDGYSAREAVLHTLNYTARPILFTSLALILGFIVFLLSSFRPVVFFGLLIAISMFNCTFATLFILPSFFIITDKIRKFFHRKQPIVHK